MERINSNPKMTISLVNAKTFQQHKLFLVDVGAAGGVQPHWRYFKDQIQVIGFEVDADECKRLNERFKSYGQQCFPVALHKDRGRREFFIAKDGDSSGFYKTEDIFSQVYNKNYVAVQNSIYLDTIDFDTFAMEHNIDHVDFMKLDAEGAELDVLHGCQKLLDKKELLGVELEVRFQKLPKHAPVFADIDIFLRSQGFYIFDLDVRRYARLALSKSMRDEKGILPPGATSTGQVLVGDALYLRDFAFDNYSPNPKNPKDAIKILKLACLYELFNLSDCAAQLLFRYRTVLNDRFDVDTLLDLLRHRCRDVLVDFRLNHDVRRNNLFGRPSVLTYLRIFAKLILGHYFG